MKEEIQFPYKGENTTDHTEILLVYRQNSLHTLYVLTYYNREKRVLEKQKLEFHQQ